MTENKDVIDGMIWILEEIRDHYKAQKVEAHNKSLKFEEERKVYSIKERTIEDILFSLRQKKKELDSKKEEGA